MDSKDCTISSALRIISFLLLIFALAQVITPLKIRLFGSDWLSMYICCILGTILGFMGNRKIAATQAIKRIGKLGAYGNLAMTIIFFPPIYFFWGYLLESLL